MEMTTITVTCDMESDLHYAGLLNEHIDRIEAAADAGDAEAEEQARRERDELVAKASEQWAGAARRIGAEMGYEVEALVASEPGYVPGAQTRTPAGTEAGEPTVEETIWQAAHDATDVI